MNINENLLVVKLGGAEGLDLDAACDDLAEIARTRPLVVVHGVSEEMNKLCEARGEKVQTLTSPSGHSSRYTPRAVRDIYVEAAENANSKIVARLRERNIAAHGLVGTEVPLNGQRKTAIRAVVGGRIRIIRDDHSGSIGTVQVEQLNKILSRNEVPVLPPMAHSSDGLLNVDGDRAAAAVAGALKAVSQVIVSNVDGLYKNFPDPTSFVPTVPYDELEDAMLWAQGRMKRKVVAVTEAIEEGVEQVIITNARVASAVSRALIGLCGTAFSGPESDDDSDR